MRYLANTTETYRVESRAEVEALPDSAAKDGKYILSKYKCDKKEIKDPKTKDVIDEFFIVTLTKTFCDIKDPDCEAEVFYEVH